MKHLHTPVCFGFLYTKQQVDYGDNSKPQIIVIVEHNSPVRITYRAIEISFRQI